MIFDIISFTLGFISGLTVSASALMLYWLIQIPRDTKFEDAK